MKTIYRIPTKEPYAYIEFESDEESVEIAVAKYSEITKMVTGGVGIDTKDFNRILDKYLWGDGTMLSDEYAAMNLNQQEMIQTIKRSRARTNK